MKKRTKLPVVVYGASGHARVVLDILESNCCWQIKGLIDDCESLWGSSIGNYQVLGGRGMLTNLYREGVRHAVVAVGSNSARRRLCQFMEQTGFTLITAIHAFSSVGNRTKIGPGTVVMPGAVVNADAEIGNGVIVNTGVTIDHECRIGDFVHISPGAHLAGNVVVGELAHIGMNAALVPGVKVGRESIVGAGTIVLDDLPASVTAVGVPAHIVDGNDPRA